MAAFQRVLCFALLCVIWLPVFAQSSGSGSLLPDSDLSPAVHGRFYSGMEEKRFYRSGPDGMDRWTGRTDPWSRLQPDSTREQESVEYPDPNKVLYRSLMIPGWGQITNRQIWKVPIIYGLFAGVTLYNLDLTRKYKGFRAAYYNETRGSETDYRFGPTPDFVPDGYTEEQLRRTRDQLHNQRDMSYIFFVLAYGLNALDAYVYAHMRSFDVSDDLSARATLGPTVSPEGAPMVRLKVGLFSR